MCCHVTSRYSGSGDEKPGQIGSFPLDESFLLRAMGGECR